MHGGGARNAVAANSVSAVCILKGCNKYQMTLMPFQMPVITFVETSTGNQFAIPHFPIDGANVTAIMVEHIRATMRVRHTSIAHFCAFYKDREVAFEKYLSLHHLPPPYVQEAVTYKRTKRKRGCELGDYEDDLANALEDDCEQFQDDADKC